MSHLLTERITKLRGLPAAQKAVLIVLAAHAHHDGSGARPSQLTIAEMSGLSLRSVQRGLHDLEAAARIVPEAHNGGRAYDGGGRGHAVEYRIRLDTLGLFSTNPATAASFEAENHAILADFSNGNHAVLADLDGNPANPTPKPRQNGTKTPPNLHGNHANMAYQSLSESLSESPLESKRENQARVQLSEQDATNSRAISLSLSHLEKEEEERAEEDDGYRTRQHLQEKRAVIATVQRQHPHATVEEIETAWLLMIEAFGDRYTPSGRVLARDWHIWQPRAHAQPQAACMNKAAPSHAEDELARIAGKRTQAWLACIRAEDAGNPDKADEIARNAGMQVQESLTAYRARREKAATPPEDGLAAIAGTRTLERLAQLRAARTKADEMTQPAQPEEGTPAEIKLEAS